MTEAIVAESTTHRKQNLGRSLSAPVKRVKNASARIYRTARQTQAARLSLRTRESLGNVPPRHDRVRTAKRTKGAAQTDRISKAVRRTLPTG